MTLRSRTTTLAFAGLMGAVVALPIGGAFADESPNTVNNATSDDYCVSAMTSRSMTGIYDNNDTFRDAAGRPCPGMEYLFSPPS